jgi:ABC-type transport system involved in cytochrome bd biosynthesis fused ATPase/permease subunit
MSAVIIVVIVAIVELLIIADMAADRQSLRDELTRERRLSQRITAELACARNYLDALQRDDARFVDQLLERGREEIEQLEEYYQRNLPAHQRPTDFGRPQ